MGRFARAIDAYVALHRRIERSISPDWMFDAEMTTAERDAFRRALVDARRHAKRGDVFTADASHVLRGRLRRAMRWQESAPAAPGDSRKGWLPALRWPEVNHAFPPAAGAPLPALFLRVLPELSAELDYRLVGRDLVLIDTHAHLVVDVLDDALPAGAEAPDGLSCGAALLPLRPLLG